jgi:hypothetical protein
MHETDGSIIELNDVLNRIYADEFEWQLLYLDAIGPPPSGDNMGDYCDSFKDGYVEYFSSTKMVREYFSNIEQVIDCLLVAYDKNSTFSKLTYRNYYNYSFKLIIEAIDSGKWVISSDSEIHLRS